MHLALGRDTIAKIHKGLILGMKKRGYLTFWPIFTMFIFVTFGFFTVESAWFFIHSLVFRNRTFVDAFNETGATFIVSALVLVVFGTSSLNKAREAITATTTMNYAPKLQEIVKVVTKTSEVSGSLLGTDTTHTITFEFAGRVRKTMEVDLKQYSNIGEGEVGMLAYKQNNINSYFVSFEPL